MPTRVVFAMIVLLGASSAASAQKHHHARPTLIVVREAVVASSNDGAKVDAETGSAQAAAAPLKTPATFVEFHSGRVQNDLMLFAPTRVGISPATTRNRNADLIARAPVKKEVRFFSPVESADGLEVRRERDRLVLFRGPQPQGAAVGVGLAMFGATTILSAHAPRPIRVLFDGPVHLGPAIFDGGGMGAGIGGRGL
ncbi:MAG: hypothetical protein JWM53_3874 [bacterium]|nr:hypothetical protein [bacterium]